MVIKLQEGLKASRLAKLVSHAGQEIPKSHWLKRLQYEGFVQEGLILRDRHNTSHKITATEAEYFSQLPPEGYDTLRMLQGYLKAALIHSTSEDGGTFDDLALDFSPSLRDTALDDVVGFLDSWGHFVTPDFHQAGAALWLARNSIQDFNPQYWGRYSDPLSAAAKALGEIELYIGDSDDAVYSRAVD
jgi:hypothetical protein